MAGAYRRRNISLAGPQGNESRLTTHRAEDFEQVLRIV
jgi:hypothetical protein